MKILGSKESVKLSFSTQKHNMLGRGSVVSTRKNHSKITDLSTTLDTLVIAKR